MKFYFYLIVGFANSFLLLVPVFKLISPIEQTWTFEALCGSSMALGIVTALLLNINDTLDKIKENK